METRRAIRTAEPVEIKTLEEAKRWVEDHGYPAGITSAFSLRYYAVADNEEDLVRLFAKAKDLSPIDTVGIESHEAPV